MKQKKWCVTGAAGFLGSHVVEQLLSKEQKVLGIDSLAWGKEEHLKELKSSPNGDFAKLDIRDEEKVKDVLEKFRPQHIIHLAALHYIPDAVKNPALALDINVRGTQSVLTAARHCDYETFFFASTGDVYAKTDEDYHETKTPTEPYNIYGLSKLFGEHLIALEKTQITAKKFIVGRIYNLIGPRETNPHIIPEIIKQLKENPRRLSLGNIWPTRDYVPVNECAKAIIELSLKTNSEVLTANIATGVGQSVEDLIKQIEKIMNHPIEIHKDPAKVRSVERTRLVANVDNLKSILGWAPTSQVEAILRDLLKSEGFLKT